MDSLQTLNICRAITSQQLEKRSI